MVRLNSAFSSGMILQAEKPVRFFGEGVGQVSVTLDGKEKSVKANGSWLLELDPVPYGGPYDITVTLDGTPTVLRDVYFGDVYLLGGQSNMHFQLKESSEPKENYRGNPYVAMLDVDRMEENAPLSTRGWVTLTKENAGDFSAIGYHVAQELATQERRIGLISCNQGASVIQSWMPCEVAAAPAFQTKEKFADHNYEWNREGHLFLCKIEPLLPLSLKGVLWYQGESNQSEEEARIYLSLLDGLIGAWRARFLDPHLPFVVVQLADFYERLDLGWLLIQEAQWKAQDVIPHVKTVVSRDVCETDDIHPKTKSLLAKRIAALLK